MVSMLIYCAEDSGFESHRQLDFFFFFYYVQCLLSINTKLISLCLGVDSKWRVWLDPCGMVRL